MEQTDRPGREIPKEYRQIATELVDNQGWRYDRNERGGHPRLFPPDKAQAMLVVPTTPSDRRALRNFVADVRKRGGVWPPPREG